MSMKKSGIYVLITITLVFAAFVAGFYVGRNQNHSLVQVSTWPGDTTLSTAPSLPKTTVSTGITKLNINLATYEELQTLPGIGPSLAQNIIDYRITYGYFHTVSDLLNVPNFGEKRLEALLEYITV